MMFSAPEMKPSVSRLSLKYTITAVAIANDIVKNTIISYEDWGGTVEFEGGESKAHMEICKEYSITCEEIYHKGTPPNVNKVFKVVEI